MDIITLLCESDDFFQAYEQYQVVINDQGELLSAQVTAGNVDDRKPVPQLGQGLFDKVFADI